MLRTELKAFGEEWNLEVTLEDERALVEKYVLRLMSFKASLSEEVAQFLDMSKFLSDKGIPWRTMTMPEYGKSRELDLHQVACWINSAIDTSEKHSDTVLLDWLAENSSYFGSAIEMEHDSHLMESAPTLREAIARAMRTTAVEDSQARVKVEEDDRDAERAS
jgi:hypothetical protein